MLKRATLIAAIATAAAIAIVAISTAGSTARPAPAQHRSGPLHLVVLGDSTAQASACTGCIDFPHLYAEDIEKATGRPVRVDNRGAPNNGILPDGYITQALGNVYTDQSLRHALADADIVLIDIGFNDTPWARLDDPCEAAPEFPTVQWGNVSDECIQRVTHEYKQTLDELLTQVDELRAGKHTILRVVDVYNEVIGDVVDPGWNTPQSADVSRRADSLMASAQCEVVGFHGGSCADIYHALNGPDGTRPAQSFLVDGTHLNQKGHRLAARTLAALGYAPLLP